MTQKATFAGGCFWCMEKPFDHVKGVVATISGYTGGTVDKPSYEQVSSGTTGHREAMQVKYDPAVVSYDHLLEIFWRNIDPFDEGGQFCDRGFQYTSAIFYHTEEQKRAAEKSKAALEKKFNRKIVTPIIKASAFYKAEEYHQDYYKKNPVRYKFYRWNCGRDQRLSEVWGGR